MEGTGGRSRCHQRGPRDAGERGQLEDGFRCGGRGSWAGGGDVPKMRSPRLSRSGRSLLTVIYCPEARKRFPAQDPDTTLTVPREGVQVKAPQRHLDGKERAAREEPAEGTEGKSRRAEEQEPVSAWGAF